MYYKVFKRVVQSTLFLFGYLPSVVLCDGVVVGFAVNVWFPVGEVVGPIKNKISELMHGTIHIYMGQQMSQFIIHDEFSDMPKNN